MNGIVLDCSVTASWCLRDETNEEANKILDLLKDHQAFVPAIWPVEMANVLVVAERRGRISAADVARMVEILLGLPIEIENAALDNLKTLRLLAREYRLSAYDACYLDLAQRRGFPIATLDSLLNRAAKKCGITTLIGK